MSVAYILDQQELAKLKALVDAVLDAFVKAEFGKMSTRQVLLAIKLEETGYTRQDLRIALSILQGSGEIYLSQGGDEPPDWWLV